MKIIERLPNQSQSRLGSHAMPKTEHNLIESAAKLLSQSQMVLAWTWLAKLKVLRPYQYPHWLSTLYELQAQELIKKVKVKIS